MPKLSKLALSRYVRTGCDRQLRLMIASGAERNGDPAAGIPPMPGEQPPRPGLQEAAREGIRWQDEKVGDLRNTFGAKALIAKPVTTRSGVEYRPIDLNDSLTQSAGLVPAKEPSVWLVEPEFEVGSGFESAVGIAGQASALGYEYARLRPDLLEVRPPAPGDQEVTASGEIRQVGENDPRLRLRVIDIKLTAEPSPGYFAEVTLYSMALAGWLQDTGRDSEFVVVSDAALWPGSHEASALATTVNEILQAGGTPTASEMREALARDLEPVPLEVFVPEIGRFYVETVPRVLGQSWPDLDYHVDNRCRNCPFLGAPWIDAEGNPTAENGHCMKRAEAEDHLSRVAYITRGARTALVQGGVSDVATLAGRSSSDPALESHFALKGSRTVVQARAAVLDQQKVATIAPQSGTSAVMPRWSDLRVQLSVDFDASSAITFAFAASAFWIEPLPYGSTAKRRTKAWGTRVFIVDQRSLAAEQREMLAFLRHLETIFSEAHSLAQDSTSQVYLWDQLQLKHLARVMGRHLPAVLADGKIRDLAWLFPSEELLPNPKAISRRSPLTILRDVVRSLVAAPVTHYYSLLELARGYHPAGLEPQYAKFSVHPLFEDPLSDQIPSERAHEIWSRSENSNRPWIRQMQTLEETVKTRLRAAEQVRRRLEDDLGSELTQTAPRIGIGAMQPVSGISQISQLWLAHAKVDAALRELEVAQGRAMPPHERESRFRSARLTSRLSGSTRAVALAQLGLAGVGPGDLVYEMRADSREVKMREGDFSVALSPEGMPGMLDQKLSRVVRETSLEGITEFGNDPLMEQVLGMTVIALDRDAGVIVLRPSDYWPQRLQRNDLLAQLEQLPGFDLSSDCILDPVNNDFFTPKLESTLKAIKNPPAAASAADQGLGLALGDTRSRGPRRTKAVPAADLLWDARAMHSERVARDAPAARKRLEEHGIRLNLSQWSAWQRALTRRLQPIWGPPGTGKSRTMRAIGLGAALDAHDNGTPIRILVGASTYTAIDNVLNGLVDVLPGLLGAGADLQLHRLRSKTRSPGDPEIDTEVDSANPGSRLLELGARLRGREGVTVVGATPEQFHNMLKQVAEEPMFEAFDLMLLDEASQTDVAHAVLFAAGLAKGAQLSLRETRDSCRRSLKRRHRSATRDWSGRFSTCWRTSTK